jgi:hypothetical protein
MAAGCRDCTTCTKPGLVKLGQDWTLGFVHIMSCGISWVIKRGAMRNCPQCKHLLSNHQRRQDGSFRD